MIGSASARPIPRPSGVPHGNSTQVRPTGTEGADSPSPRLPVRRAPGSFGFGQKRSRSSFTEQLYCGRQTSSCGRWGRESRLPSASGRVAPASTAASASWRSRQALAPVGAEVTESALVPGQGTMREIDVLIEADAQCSGRLQLNRRIAQVCVILIRDDARGDSSGTWTAPERRASGRADREWQRQAITRKSSTAFRNFNCEASRTGGATFGFSASSRAESLPSRRMALRPKRASMISRTRPASRIRSSTC
jgi:hypothetical protein